MRAGVRQRKRRNEQPSLGEGSQGFARAGPKVSTSRLKDFATTSLPEGSKLRDLLLSEKDEMKAEVFIAKMDLWLKLLRMEFVRRVEHWQGDEEARARDMVSG